jgi:hypothetical protein
VIMINTKSAAGQQESYVPTVGECISMTYGFLLSKPSLFLFLSKSSAVASGKPVILLAR